MSKEALKLFKGVKELWITLQGKAYYDCNGGQDFDKAISLLESEPESGEFTKEKREQLLSSTDYGNYYKGWLLEACDRIDRLKIDLKCMTAERDSYFEAYQSQKDEIDKLKKTNQRLNRRCQRAKKAANENIEKCRRAGVSLGRALANYGYCELVRTVQSVLPYIDGQAKEILKEKIASAATERGQSKIVNNKS